MMIVSSSWLMMGSVLEMVVHERWQKFTGRMNASVTDDVLLQLATRHGDIKDFMDVCFLV